MTTRQTVKDRGLSSKIDDFIRGKQGGEIGDLIDLLSPMGDCAIFGGLPRDFARKGCDAFKSDVDIVVDGAPDDLSALLGHSGVQRNRFGGYRLKHGRFDFDVWTLQTTWAVEAGHVKARSLTDLVKTTFFDCDAILFHCRTKEISRSEQFWQSIENGIVDINLESNPHYIDTIVRTLKIHFNRNDKLTPRLFNHLEKGIKHCRHEIVEYATRNDVRLGIAGELKLDSAISILSRQFATNPS